MQVSKNFSLNELVASETALRTGIDNTPNQEHIDNIAKLCTNILQPLRDEFGALRITSGYRCAELCEAIGSSSTSDHTKGCAVDFKPYRDVKMVDIVDFIHKNNIQYDKLICEYWKKEDIKNGWIHITFNDRNRCLLMEKQYGASYVNIDVNKLQSLYS